MKTLIISYILSSAITTGTSVAAHNRGCYEGAVAARYLPAINNNAAHIGYKAGQTVSLVYIIHLWDKKFKEDGKSNGAPKAAVIGMTLVNTLDSIHNLRVHCEK